MKRITQNLNGVWSFAFYGDACPKPPFTVGEPMAVPGCFDLMEPYCGKRGYAVYSRKVNVGGKAELFIDGAGLAAWIYFDGRRIGQMPCAYQPGRFFFNAGAEGEHELSIVIDNRYNEYFQDYNDFYGYGGIYGDVELTRLPSVHIRALRVATLDYRTGRLKLMAEASSNYSGKARILFDTGFQQEVQFENGAWSGEVTLPDFQLWSPENPHLHQVTLFLKNDEVTESFGVRQASTQGRKLLLNGRELKLLGVNRHESFPIIGAAMPPQLIAYDLRILREAGFNFIRGSHYPQRRFFLEMCDRMGFLVWEESLGWDVRTPKLHSKRFLKEQLWAAEALTLSSYNHPCVIIRGFLNENQSDKPKTATLIQALYDKIRSLDETCLISYSSNRYEKDVCTHIPDIVAMNPYPGWYDAGNGEPSGIANIPKVLAQLSKNMPQDKPLLITEIGAEAIYGFRDPLKVRWSEAYQEQLVEECCRYVFTHPEEYAGITIWHFSDTRSYVTGPHIYGRARGFNNKGLLDEYRRPKMAWEAIRRMVKNGEFVPFPPEKAKTGKK